MPVRQLLTRRPFSRVVVTSLTSFVALATFACGLDKLTNPTTPAQAIAALNASVAGDTTVSMGGTLPLHVTTAQGALASTVGVIWSSDKPTVATVDSSTGVVTGVGLGTATISATVVAPELGQVPATSLTIRVKYAGIKITAVDSLIAIGMTKVLNVQGRNPAGTNLAAIPFSAAMTVTSRDTTIFTVNSAGALVAVKNGSATLFVQFDGLKDSTTVKVRQVTRSMTFPAANSAGQLAIGSLNKARTLAVSASDSLGVAIAAPTVTWGSSDITIVTVVAATGVATALKAGTVTITATADGLAKPITAIVSQVPGLLTKTAATDAQSAVVNTSVALAPEVTVADSGGSIMPNVAVTFAVTSGGGTLAGATPTSAAVTGKASVTTWTLGTTAGANTVVATAGAASATFTATGTFGPAKKLAFVVQPAAASAGATIAPPIQIAVVDSLNNVVTNATTPITVAVGNNPGAATLTGTLTVAAVNGIASFADLKLSAAGSGYTLLASATALAAATSNPFSIFGAATKVVFTTQPQNGRANQTLAAIKVSVQDAGGNVVTNATNSVVVAITAGTGISGAILSGTKTIVAVNGVATYSDLSIDQFGATAYTLTATSGALTSGTSGTFTIAKVGAPAKVGFLVQPTNAISGATISPSIQVAVQDSGGATVDTATSAITLGIETNPGSGSLSGTVTVNAVSGIATFSTISINKVGTGYKLNAITGTLTKGVSAAFNIAAGAAAKLGFVAQPPDAVTATTLSPAVQVAVQDASGNTVTTATTSITLGVTAGTGSSGATLVGGSATAAVSGIATFSGLSISTLGTNYTITATANGLSNGVSSTFNIVAANAAIKLGFTTQPGNGTSGTAIPQFTVAIQDASGNTITSAPTTSIAVSLSSSSPSGGTISGTLSATTSAGVATFSNVLVPIAGSGYTLTATASGLNSGTSAAFNVTFGAKSKVVFLTQPTNITAGTAFAPTIQAAIADAAGNTVTTASDVVQVSAFGPNGSGGTISLSISGTSSTAAVNGIATFTNFSVIPATTGATLSVFSSAVQFSSASVAFNVTAGAPSALTFKTQPAAFTAGGTFTSPVQVAVTDAVGNVITTASNSITLGLASSPTGGSITGTLTASASSGVATFSGLGSTVAGFYQLSATATGLSSTTSNGFAINAGAAAGVKWRVIPANATANATLLGSGNQNLRADVVDANGNTVTSATNSITVSITTSTGTAGAVLSSASNALTQAASSGQVFYSDLKINKGGTAATSTAYKLHAASGTLTMDDSPAFDVAFFSTANIVNFVTQPTTMGYGVVPTSAVTAAVQDQFGNTVTTDTRSITINMQSGSGTVLGTNTVNAVAGVATFNAFALSQSGTFSLNACATAGSLSCGISNTFTVNATGTLASGLTAAYSLVTFGSNVFWSDNSTGKIQSAATTGGTVTTLATGTNPGGIATDGTNIYWIENQTAGSGAIKRVPIGGTTVTTVISGLTLSSTAGANHVETDGTNVYFVSKNAAGTFFAIRRIAAGSANATSSGATDLFTAASTNVPTFSLISGTIYYADGAGLVAKFTSTAATPITPTTLVASGTATNVNNFVVLGSTLYYVNASNGNLVSVSTSGGSASVSGTITSAVTVATDGTLLYVTRTGTGLVRFNTASLVTSTIASTFSSTGFGILLNGSDVYWTDASGVISKAGK